MSEAWTAERVLGLASDYRAVCVLSAGVDLRVFEAVADGALEAEEIAERVEGDVRATRILLDALCALGVLEKREERYVNAAGIDGLLVDHRPGSVLAMAHHHGCCLRRWARLAEVVKAGKPAERFPSVQGEDADAFAFIEAMDNISAPAAPAVFGKLGDLECECALDVGGGSGTWLVALLRENPRARGILFDLPHVIPMARRRLEREGMIDRVELVAGDFYADPLPTGADLVWLSAIAHQNSREQNRALYAKMHAALGPGGQVLVRDAVLAPSRTTPEFGALFAVNMLVATEQGNTYTLDEYREDLEHAGFEGVELRLADAYMNAVVGARKPR